MIVGPTELKVETRDRGVVPFDKRRVVEAILEAMTGASATGSATSAAQTMASPGSGAVDVADELASAVAHFLQEYKGHSAIRVDEIHDMVEKVLMETGHREVARSYIILREKRARIRRQIRVRPPLSDESVPLVQDRHDSTAHAWDRARIVTALMEEGDVEADIAESVAKSVEERVVRSGMRSISTSLLRELVNNELFELGVTGGLRRQAQLSLPKYDLEKLLFRGGDPNRGLAPGDPTRIAERVGGQMLRQYVLDDVYSSRVRETMAVGELHLHRLDRPLQLLRLSVAADRIPAAGMGVARGGDPQKGRALHALFHRIADTLPVIAEEIEVFNIGEALLADRHYGILDCAECGRTLLRALREYHEVRARGPQPAPVTTLRIPFTPRYVASASTELFAASELEANLAEDAAWVVMETLRHALLESDGARLLGQCRLKLEISPATFQQRRFRETLRSVLSLIEEDAPLGMECLPEERVVPLSSPVAGKVTINLVRLALAARRNGESDLRPRLAALAEVALEAVRGHRDFFDKLRLHPESPLADLDACLPELPPHEYAIGIVGVDDAVRILTGESLDAGDGPQVVALNWIQTLATALAEARRPGDPVLVLEETWNHDGVRRLESLDQAEYASELEGGAASPDSAEEDGVYASGVRFGRWAPLDPLQKWQRLAPYRPHVRLLDTLDDTARLRADGVEVLIAFLEEACRAPGLGVTPSVIS
ncbi:MAG: ATP cone domain-containing protein [Planctomycetota bacterium]